MTNRPRKPSADLSPNPAAFGAQTGDRSAESLPTFRALLENGKVSRWRLTLGALLHGLVVTALLLLPLVVTDSLNGVCPPVDIIITPPVPRGDPQGTEGVKPGPKPQAENKPSVTDPFFVHVYPIPPATPAGDLPINRAGVGPQIGEGGSPWGSPEGEEGVPPFMIGPLGQPPPPAQSPAPPPVDVGGKVLPPRLVRRVEPAYPRSARLAGIEGRVVLEAILDENGRVMHIEVKSGHGALIPAAVDAVSQWAYEPTYLNNRPVPVRLNVAVEFRLRH